jgi:hypothetical protein
MNWRGCIIVTLLLATICACLFGYVLCSPSGIFREFHAALVSVQWTLLVCIAFWCGTFLFLTFSTKDLPLIGLLLIAITAFFISYAVSQPVLDALVLLAGVMLGKGTVFLLKAESGKRKAEISQSGLTSAATFLIGLVLLLTFSSWWHLDVAHDSYPGTRWTGLWYNPNEYGVLMGVSTTLGIALQVLSLKSKIQSPKAEQKRKLTITFLIIAIAMMAVGLVMSYSRGAWLATAVGLLYLAWCYGKLKWRFVLPVILAAATVVVFFWHSTADTAPWYLKRLDFSRPSAQHRVSAWRGALQMMWDHPLGVGWNQAVSIYDKSYSPPEGGAAALTMNSYLMLGTELGLPGLFCFVAYVGLCFRRSPHLTLPHPQPLSNPIREDSVSSPAGSGEGKVSSPGPAASQTAPPVFSRDGGLAITLCDEASQLRCACRAGALVFLVAFWFDGGLFTLATASVFWILLELGTSDLIADTNC